MIKRLFDIIISISILLGISPILLIIALIIILNDGRPILFQQIRSGKDKKPFKFYKFRTMNNNLKMQDVHRITSLGRFLRKTSLDELPSFFNVLKGDMSVVGPRPLLERYLSRYDEYQIRRLEVKPGITGLAQINGRNNLSWNERFDFDIRYVDKHNIFLDIRIIFDTIFLVFSGKGITPNNQEIMPEFKGNKTID